MLHKRVMFGLFVILSLGGGYFVGQYMHTVVTLTPEPTFTTALAAAEYYFSPAHYDLVRARQYYEQAIAQDAQGSNLQWYQLARINFLEGHFDAALQALAKQQEYFADQVPNVYYMIGLVHGFRADYYGDVRDWQAAEVGFLKFLEYVPSSPWARIDLSWIYFSTQRYDDMIAVLEPIYDDNQDNPWYLNMYGLAHMNNNDYSTAYEYFTQAQQLANELKESDWAQVYPENSPEFWQRGLVEFREAIRRNIDMAVAGKDGDKRQFD